MSGMDEAIEEAFICKLGCKQNLDFWYIIDQASTGWRVEALLLTEKYARFKNTNRFIIIRDKKHLYVNGFSHFQHSWYLMLECPECGHRYPQHTILCSEVFEIINALTDENVVTKTIGVDWI